MTPYNNTNQDITVTLAAGESRDLTQLKKSTNWRLRLANSPVKIRINGHAQVTRVQGDGSSESVPIERFIVQTDIAQTFTITYGLNEIKEASTSVQVVLDAANAGQIIGDLVADAVSAGLVGSVHFFGDDVVIPAGQTVDVLAADANRLQGFVNADVENEGFVRVSPVASGVNGQKLEAGGEYEFKTKGLMRVHNPNASDVTVRVETIGN